MSRSPDCKQLLTGRLQVFEYSLSVLNGNLGILCPLNHEDRICDSLGGLLGPYAVDFKMSDFLRMLQRLIGNRMNRQSRHIVPVIVDDFTKSCEGTDDNATSYSLVVFHSLDCDGCAKGCAKNTDGLDLLKSGERRIDENRNVSLFKISECAI